MPLGVLKDFGGDSSEKRWSYSFEKSMDGALFAAGGNFSIQFCWEKKGRIIFQNNYMTDFYSRGAEIQKKFTASYKKIQFAKYYLHFSLPDPEGHIFTHLYFSILSHN